MDAVLQSKCGKGKKAYIKHIFSTIRGFSFTPIVKEIFNRYVSKVSATPYLGVELFDITEVN